MKYRTYVADTLQQAILKMTVDMGKDALLVNHRNIYKGGILGFFSKKMVEVTAGLPMKTSQPLQENSINPSASQGIFGTTTGGATSSQVIAQPTATNIASYPQKETSYQSGSHRNVETEVMNELQRDIQDMKRTMDSMIGEIKGTPLSKYPGTSGELYLRLIENNVKEELVEALIKRVIADSPGTLIEDEEFMERQLQKYIKSYIRTSGPIQLTEGITKIVALIGPTGVGKTTTIAKLAADFSFEKRRKVAIITVDTYRIAAVEQLKAYADILEIPLSVAFSPLEFKQAIERYCNYELVLVDTAGRSQRNSMQMAELKGLIDIAGYKLETYLLISTTTKDEETVDIVENFKRVGFNHLIFTKLDESVTFGSILNLAVQIPQGISYVTMGQNVPEDIEVADSTKLSRLILGIYQNR